MYFAFKRYRGYCKILEIKSIDEFYSARRRDKRVELAIAEDLNSLLSRWGLKEEPVEVKTENDLIEYSPKAREKTQEELRLIETKKILDERGR